MAATILADYESISDSIPDKTGYAIFLILQKHLYYEKIRNTNGIAPCIYNARTIRDS